MPTGGVWPPTQPCPKGAGSLLSISAAQNFRAENDVGAAGLPAQAGGVTHRHGAFDDHRGAGVAGQHVLHHGFNRLGVEVVGGGVAVGRGGDDDEICAAVGRCLV